MTNKSKLLEKSYKSFQNIETSNGSLIFPFNEDITFTNGCKIRV